MTDLFGQKELRALSWKEPFATLMLHGKIETRTWATSYRGLVLICASKIPYTLEAITHIAGWTQYDRIARVFMKYGYILSENCGQAIAIGELIGCRPMKPEDENACFVEYWNGLYCHIYENVRIIKPIPFKGQQGWKRLNGEFINQMELGKKII